MVKAVAVTFSIACAEGTVQDGEVAPVRILKSSAASRLSGSWASRLYGQV
jgi:hypothetical protein